MASTAEDAWKRLQELASGLLLISESDYPLTVVRLAAPPADAQPVELAAFFARATEPQPYHTTAELLVVERYRALVRFLSEELAEARVYRVGAIEVDVFALGRLPESGNGGEWLGVASKLIET